MIYSNIYLINNTNSSSKCNYDTNAYIQYTVVLRLSPKDMRPYPNTLLIRSLLGVNFWVFHPKDLTPFLIRPLWVHSISHFSFLFIFALFRVFSFSFLFHITISFSSHNHDSYEVQSNHILTFIIFQDVILFILIMFHNFQQSTQRFFFTLITTNIKENSQLICIASKHSFKP